MFPLKPRGRDLFQPSLPASSSLRHSLLEMPIFPLCLHISLCVCLSQSTQLSFIFFFLSLPLLLVSDYPCRCNSRLPHLDLQVFEVLAVKFYLTLCDTINCSHQARLSKEFSRQKYWSGLPFPSLGDLPDPGIEPRSPAIPDTFFTV